MDNEHALVLLKIASAMDLAMTAFERDERVIFEEEKALLEFKYGHLPKDRLIKKTIKQCSYHDCKNKPIESSHTIQKSGSLNFIAENGHLVSPQSFSKIDQDFGEIGINEASTFPGFCEHHEALFSRFENGKEFNDEQDFRLQLYRTICREIVSSQLLSKKLVYSKAYYQKFRNDKLDSLFEIALSGYGLTLEEAGVKKRKTRLKDRAVHLYNKDLKIMREYRKQLKKLANAIFADLQSSSNNKFYFDSIECDFEIPIALAGRGSMKFQNKSVTREIDVIINVIPQNGKTYILMGALKIHRSKIKWYLSHFIDNPLSLITMVESWMLYGSDHWFIKPSVWKKLTSKVVKEAYDEIHYSKKNIMAIPQIAILTDARINLLRFYKALGETHKDIYEAILEHLKDKEIEVPSTL